MYEVYLFYIVEHFFCASIVNSWNDTQLCLTIKC